MNDFLAAAQLACEAHENNYAAAREVRALTGCGLREAMMLVENERRHRRAEQAAKEAGLIVEGC